MHPVPVRMIILYKERPVIRIYLPLDVEPALVDCRCLFHGYSKPILKMNRNFICPVRFRFISHGMTPYPFHE